ncbi:MAG: glycosyltransferase family 87 protein [Candidatus Dormiibacterota bacterium]
MARVTGGPRLTGSWPFPYLPWVGMVMAPFSVLPFWIAFALWDALGLAMITVATWRWAVALDWRHPWWAAMVAGGSSVAVVNYFLGQVSTVVLALLVAALLAAKDRRYGWAGAIAMTGALLKPQDLWPLILLVWLVPESPTASAWARIALGQISAFLILVGTPLLVSGALLGSWLQLLIHFGSRLPSQRELVGLPGLLAFTPANWHLSPSFQDPVVVVMILLGCLAIVVMLHRLLLTAALLRLPPARRIGWLLLLPLGVWMLVTPYGHTQDVVVAFPLTMLALGDGGAALRRPFGWVLVTSVLVIPVAMIFFSDYLFPPESLAPVGLLILVSMAVAALRHELAAKPSAVAPPEDAAAVSESLPSVVT